MRTPSRNTPRSSTLAESFQYAWQGIAHTLISQRNFKIELAIGALAVILGIVFSISRAEWLAIVICIGVVLGLECLNTALEALVDLESPARNPLAKTAKDCAAGAVLLAACMSLVVAAIVFLPHIFGIAS